MSDEHGSEEQNESGGLLRQKLEASLARNKELETLARTFQAKDLIREKGFTHLTPEDLMGFDDTELEAKATELETQKAAAEADVLRRALEAKGLTADQLDQALAALTSGTTGTNTQPGVREASRIGGAPPGSDRFAGLTGKDLLYAAYAEG